LSRLATGAALFARAYFRLATDCDIAVLRKLADRIWRTSYAGTISQAQVDYMLAWMYAEENDPS
jgi:hypothetical protein